MRILKGKLFHYLELEKVAADRGSMFFFSPSALLSPGYDSKSKLIGTSGKA